MATAHWLKKIGVEPMDFLTAQTWRPRRCRSGRESPKGVHRERASRKRRVRSLLPPLLRQRPDTRVQGSPAFGWVRPPGCSAASEEGLGQPSWTSSGATRDLDCEPKSATSRVLLALGPTVSPLHLLLFVGLFHNGCSLLHPVEPMRMADPAKRSKVHRFSCLEPVSPGKTHDRPVKTFEIADRNSARSSKKLS